MKNRLFILSLLAALVLASCGTTGYYSSVYNDSIYSRPDRARVTIVGDRAATTTRSADKYTVDVYELEDGETYEALDARCAALLEQRIPALENDCSSVLMCSHGALIKGVVRRLLRRPLRDFWIDPAQVNCSRTILECINGQVRLVSQGELFRLNP